MGKLVSLSLNEDKIEKATFKGLAPVVCYEPWFPRCLEAIKQCLQDGHPLLVRLHSAANYPLDSDECYTLDLESHAVLIVGYDDEKQAVAVVDPWNKNWGGDQSGKTWISYEAISRRCVNTSLGMAMCLAPMQVHVTSQFDAVRNLSIDAEIGFYIPRGVVMDRDSWAIKKIIIECDVPTAWGNTIRSEIEGNWIVGDSIKVSLPIASKPACDGEIKVRVQAEIQGKRPYEFSDCIEMSKHITICVEESKQSTIHCAAV